MRWHPWPHHNPYLSGKCLQLKLFNIVFVCETTSHFSDDESWKFVILVSGKYGGISQKYFLTIMVIYNMKLGTFWYLKYKTVVRTNHDRHPKFWGSFDLLEVSQIRIIVL